MLTRLQIDRIEPFADGMAFGTVGSYVRLVGTAYGELDPQHPRNAVIVNIDKAPRNARGYVEYDTDVYIMRPTDVSKGNRKLLYEVNNRGRKRLLSIFHEAHLRPRRPPPMTPPRSTMPAMGFCFVRAIPWSGVVGTRMPPAPIRA